MKSFNVLMLAFGQPDEIRQVDVCVDQMNSNGNIANVSLIDILNEIYRLGQNDFQPKKHPSVSMGDVIVVEKDHYLVCMSGFHKLSQFELDLYKAVPRPDRSLHVLKLRGEI